MKKQVSTKTRGAKKHTVAQEFRPALRPRTYEPSSERLPDDTTDLDAWSQAESEVLESEGKRGTT